MRAQPAIVAVTVAPPGQKVSFMETAKFSNDFRRIEHCCATKELVETRQCYAEYDVQSSMWHWYSRKRTHLLSWSNKESQREHRLRAVASLTRLSFCSWFFVRESSWFLVTRDSRSRDSALKVGVKREIRSLM